MDRTEQQKKYREANKEKIAAKKKEWREKNATKVAEYRKQYKKDNPEKVKQENEEWREKNATKVAEYRKRYKKANPEKVKQWKGCKITKQLNKLATKESCYKKWLQASLSNCKLRHKKNDYNSHITCEITLEDLVTKYEAQKGFCAISKVKMEHKQGSLNSISIDRVDNNLGYTIENTHLVVKWINIGRRNATLDQIKQAIQDVIEANKETVA